MSRDTDYAEYCLKAGIENRNTSTATLGSDRIQELATEILRLRGEPASSVDEHFAFAFVRHLFLSQMERAEKAEAALAEAEAKLKEKNGD